MEQCKAALFELTRQAAVDASYYNACDSPDQSRREREARALARKVWLRTARAAHAVGIDVKEAAKNQLVGDIDAAPGAED